MFLGFYSHKENTGLLIPDRTSITDLVTTPLKAALRIREVTGVS